MSAIAKETMEIDDLERTTLKELVLSCPPEIALMANKVKDFDRIRENDFFRKFVFWVFSSIDSNLFSLHVARQLFQYFNDKMDLNHYVKYRENIISKQKKEIYSFIASLYDQETGGFYQTHKNRRPTLHAIHCVVGAVGSVYKLNEMPVGIFDDRETIDYDWKVKGTFFDNELQTYLPVNCESFSSSILNYVANCYDNETGGFFETPKSVMQRYNKKLPPTIVATASAIWIVNQLAVSLDTFLDEYCKTDRDTVKSFVYNKRIQKDNWCAFTNSEMSTDPYICTAYYAERTLRLLDGENIDYDVIKQLMNFIVRQKRKGSAFGAGNGLGPNLIHTKNALSIIRRYPDVFESVKSRSWWKFNPLNFLEKTCLDVAEFMKTTIYRGGFAPAEANKYLPNLYSTRIGYDILRYFKIYQSLFGINIPDTNNIIHPDETLTFIYSCTADNSTICRGFTREIEFIPPDYLHYHYGISA